MISELWERVRFDEQWYLWIYPDVAAAVETGLFENAYDHYCRRGRSEQRFPRKPLFDERFYQMIYPDVRRKVENQELKSGLHHYVYTGRGEGRCPRPLDKLWFSTWRCRELHYHPAIDGEGQV